MNERKPEKDRKERSYIKRRKMRHTKKDFFLLTFSFGGLCTGYEKQQKKCLCALLKVIYGLAALLNPDVI